MASVAICPHCYLQLIVPDGIEPEEMVECPTCTKEFGLDQAVLRAIPEVVRRQRTAATNVAPAANTPTDELPSEIELADDVAAVDSPTIRISELERAAIAPDTPSPAATNEPPVLVDERVEIDELVTTTDADSESAIIEEIKARIDAEIAADKLPPGTYSLPLRDSLTEDPEEPLPTIEPAAEGVAAWFRHADTVPDVPPVDDLAAERELADELSDELPADEATAQAASDAEIQIETDELSIPAEIGIDAESAPPVEPEAARPAMRTLADWMPPSAERKSAAAGEPQPEEELGPSFDLPNVPLSPPLGATVEIDPSESFGPVAETEFELDDVDFDATPVEEPETNETSEEPSAADEPVFSEPAAAVSEPPFVLPRVPKPRRKRSLVRTLVGVAAGGVGGTIAALYILLWLLGPDGDFLQVAQYLPSAILPKSFHASQAQLASATPPAAAPREDTAGAESESPVTTDRVATEDTAGDESANVPAAYTVETEPSTEVPAPLEAADDDRYGATPAPLDEPVAEPIADEPSHSAAAVPLPPSGPTFTAAQLTAAFDAGRAAQRGLVDGDLSDASVRRTKGMSYAKLCDLAEALTFVDHAEPSTDVDEATESADQLFRETLADQHTRGEVGRIAQIWIDSPHRTHGGIVLAGTLGEGRIAGDVYEYELTDEVGNRLTLLMQEPVDPLQDGSEYPVAIVGSIVDRPSDKVAGYNGTADRAIWVARTIPLD